MHDVWGDEDGVTRVKQLFLLPKPLFHLAIQHVDRLFLVGMLVEVVAMARNQRDLDDDEVGGAGAGGAANPPQGGRREYSVVLLRLR